MHGAMGRFRPFIAGVLLASSIGAAQAAEHFYFRLRPSVTILNQDPFSLRIDGDNAGVVNSNFSAKAEASASRETLRFSITEGALPDGVDIDASSGSIRGIPLARGRFMATVTAQDAFSTASAPLSIMVYDALTVESTLSPFAYVGEAYSATFKGVGGDQTFAWTLSGTPPLGLTLGGATSPTASISGTPTTAGRSDGLRVSVADGAGHSASGSLFGIYVADPLTLVGTPLTIATVGEFYSTTFMSTGGHAPAWTYSGTLPGGLSPSNGVISGIPTTPGTYPGLIVRITDTATGRTLPSSQFSIVVSGPLVLAGAPSRVATVGKPYTASFSASGGKAPYTWTSSGTPPTGLTIAANGTMSGTPTEAGTSGNIVITVTDGDGRSKQSEPFSVVVSDELKIAGVPTAIGTVGASYSYSFTTSGGEGVKTWSVLSGTLPGGLTVSNGTISGSPNAAGTASNVVVRVTDAVGRTADSNPFSIVVSEELKISGLPTAIGTVGTAYSFSFASSGGEGTKTWSVVSGALPSGLTVPNGTISGSPTAAGTASSVVVRVTDAVGRTADSNPFSIAVYNQMSMSGVITGSGLKGQGFSSAVTASGGRAPYTWASVGNPLPGGLNLSNGTVSGTPSIPGTYSNIILRATDGDGRSAQTAAFSITITNPVTPGSAGFGSSTSWVVPNYNSISFSYVNGTPGGLYDTCDGGWAEWCLTTPGGAGGASYVSSANPAPGSVITITVGAGGAAGWITYADPNTGFPATSYGYAGGSGAVYVNWN
jgi:hypothetical protein